MSDERVRTHWDGCWEVHPGCAEARRKKTVLLLECFSPGGNSRGLYWSGRQNRVIADSRGVEATFNVWKARRIPLDCRDIADQLAEALTKLDQSGCEWRAVEHAFL